jgi:trans-aconitate methyltransferase
MPYDETLFASAAGYYAKYRVPYPPELIADIVSHYGLDGTGRLLDLGCGPGTFTVPLASHFAEVVAVDADAGMIDEGRSTGAANVAWHVMRAEDVPASFGKFRLVTFGSSFHWMDRDLVLRRVRDEWLVPGGGVALAGGPSTWWDGGLDWHQTITRVVQKYLGEDRRAGKATVKAAMHERFEEVLPRNGWRVELYRDYDMQLEWSADSIVGNLWSTSFANQTLFGERVGEFEADLRAELTALRPDGVFRETGGFGLVCGRPPA